MKRKLIQTNEGNTMRTFAAANTNYEVRSEVHQGKKHVVVPVIMMVEGVHSGSHGPLFHSIDELGKYPDTWNGIPVTIEHPQIDGQGISANCPEVIDTTTVGRVYNTYIEDKKLRGEAWIDEEKLRQVSPTALMYIAQNKPLDVSLGMFTDDEEIEGIWNNESYIGIAHNHRPDHLALLPGGTGACSWEDGCGIRNNNKEGGEKMDVIKMVKELTGKGYAVIQMNEQGMAAVVQAVREKIDSMDNESRVHYLEEVYDDYVVYRSSTRGEDITPVSRLYKRPYSIKDDSIVEFTGDPVPVVRKVSYLHNPKSKKSIRWIGDPVPVVRKVSYEELNNNANNKKGGKTMADNNKDTKRCCPEKVELLIQNEYFTFVEADREWLEGMEEQAVDKILSMQKGIDDKIKALEDKVKEDQNVNMNKDQAIQVLQEQFSDPNKFMQLLPKDVRAQIEHGMKLHQEEKANTIQKILNCTDAYTEDELKAMEMGSLVKLSKAVKAPVDYSAQNSGTAYQKVTEEPLIPPQI